MERRRGGRPPPGGRAPPNGGRGIRAAFASTAFLLLALPPGASSAFWQRKKVKPRITRPSGPTNVTLHVVSRTELGVAWEPPLFDGGRAISKYLVEWDTDSSMTRGIASPSNPYGNGVDGPLVRSEVVASSDTSFRIAGLDEGRKYYVRVSAYGDGYSNAVSSAPECEAPAASLPGYLTDVSLAVATDSDTADRLRLAWSAPEVDVNGFSALPAGCAGGPSPPSAPDALDAYRVMWDTHPSFSNARVYDVPAVSGDGLPKHCCPSAVGDDGACSIELGAEVQTVTIRYPQSSVPSSGGDLFDTGAVRIAYVGSQSKSVEVIVPSQGSREVRIAPSASLPASSPIAPGDLIRVQGNVYLVSNVGSWPESISISSDYQLPPSSGASNAQPGTVRAHFATPPGSCFDVSSAGNSAASFRSHLSQNFDGSPFDESIEVSRSTLTEPYESGGGSGEARVVGYEYHVTFSGQGFSSTLGGGGVEELLIVSDPASHLSSAGDCSVPFVSGGVDVSSQVSLGVSTAMESGTIAPGQKYYVRVAGVNAEGVGPYVPATPEAEIPRSQPGLAQNCVVRAVPSASSSLKVEWDGVYPDHGLKPSSYRVDFYDMDAGLPAPVASEVVNNIDESSRYLITKDGLVPGTAYKVLIVPVNELGEGGPSWYSDFSPSGLFDDGRFSAPSDYLEKSCHALPSCESGSVECAEIDAGSFEIVARSVPPRPRVEVGTYPSISNRNRFSEDSILVTFESPLTVNAASSGVPTDKFLVEWSTSSSFLRSPDQGVETLWSSVVAAEYSDGDGENAAGELLLASLAMGTQYYVRVSAHNSAGYGSPSISVPVKPMTMPDPPFEPTLSSLRTEHLASLHPDSTLSDSALIGTSLLVSWQPPRVDDSNDRPDLVGDGGDAVSSYLVEWSRISWDSYSPTVFEINLETQSGARGSDALGILSGSFQLLVDTSASTEAAVSGSYASAAIPVDAPSVLLKTILENVPNVGEVEVQSPQPFTWRVTFLTELGDLGVTLADNGVIDTVANVAGTADISKVSAGVIPANAAYGFEVINDIENHTWEGAIHFTIEHLVPGMRLYVRTSAGNQVGFGRRRKTAPEFSSPALRRPDYPASLYSDDMPPYLSVHSPNALEVHIGPPFYDGGSPLTSFLIEYDSSPTFDSNVRGDGSALGSARANAASQVCSSCISSFDMSTHTFTYSGSEVTAMLLVPQRKIMVHFHDDDESYTFSVLSATTSTITVSSEHLRVLSLDSMQGQGGGAGSDLELLGTTFIIDGLDTGRAYYVRVSSENGEMGTGKSVQTMPLRETPRGFPLPPSSASARVLDTNTLHVSWSSDAHLSDPNIEAYKVERFWRSGTASSSTSSFFGEQEVVELSTVGLGLTGGTFHLYYGGLDSSNGVVLGTAKAIAGLGYVETDADLSPHLHRGESILVGDEQYSVHETGLFTRSVLPLSTAYTGDNAEAVPIIARPKSMPIAHDASAEDVRNALEQMPHVNHVEVRREIDEANNDGYQWFVTFMTNVGPQPGFTVDTSKLIGTNPLGLTIDRAVEGILPDGYDVTVIQDPTVTSLDIENLVTGKPYYIRVSSVTDRGDSLPVDAMPMPLAPGGVPGEVSSPSIRPLNDTALLVSFEAAAEANGAHVEEYVVESSPDSSFSNSATVTVQPSHKFQRITTRAHSLPWDDSSSFTLSLGDYHGDFTVPVGLGTTTVRVQNGDNVLERSTGTASLSSEVARGDFLSVGGVEFRVCLSNSHLYDDTHLTLCSKDDALQEANIYADSALDVIDELPIFVLDTTLGAAKSPSVGDMFLSTVDASGSSNDARNRIRRGDLIRVGHPEHGETFRVSTDLARAFTDRVVPLSSADDASTPASLSSVSLQHATYEVMSFYIRSSSENVVLSAGSDITSGFRIRFKSETTRSTTSGGAEGCLKWDGDAIDMKVELETLSGIDMVEVTREDLASIPGGVGAGVKYYVTFTGLNVRGNVPPLQIVDVGTNGCLDAHLLGGTFSEDIAPIVIEQVETPFVPFYEIQTTTDIPYDASSADVKSALEALSQACTVDVSRKVNRHGYSWDVTFAEVEGSSYSPLLALSANGGNLHANIDPAIDVFPIQHVEVASAGGTPRYVRVAAVNSFGIGKYALSNPRSEISSPQPPAEPVDVFAEAISDTEILVQWNPPLENGGRPITHYKVEYDELASFTGGHNNGPYGSISVSSSSVGTISDVQTVTVKIDRDGLMNNEAYLSGTFSLEFDGQKTGQLPYNASPEEMKLALEDLCNVHEVQVARSIHCSPDPSNGCMAPEGYSWLVTFVSLRSPGDQHHRAVSNLSPRTSHKLSVDGSFLFECSDVGRTTCSIGGNAVANVATVQEVQEVTVASSPFSVTIGGKTSQVINIGDSLSDVEEKLGAIETITVACTACVGGVINSGDSMLLHFASFRGDLPPVVVSDPSAVVTEITKGSGQFVVGRSSYSAVIPGLTSVHDWNVRVFAYNGVGEGFPEVAWPSPLRLTSMPPQVPENVAVTIPSATSLQVAWDRPSSIGGAQLSSFIVQYDTSPSFTTRNGMPLGELTVTEADADASIAIVSQSYPDSSDPILRRRIIINNADVISQGTIGTGSPLVVGGQHLTVVSINEESCGVACLTVDEDYVGTSMSGVRIYPGLDPRQYKLLIPGLTPGTEYFARVAAMNENSLGPFAFDGYPFHPVSATPVDVPAAPSWTLLSVHSEQGGQLRIDYGTPSASDKPYGANGSPPSRYHIELALQDGADAYRPEVVSLSLRADEGSTVSGHVELSVGFQSDYDMIVSVGNRPAQFMVDPGSRWIDTMGDDLTASLHPGEKLVIEGETVEVIAVFVDRLEVKEYHVRGTNGVAVLAYRMNNYVGSAEISPGDTSLTEANGRNLESVLRTGEVVEVSNSSGGKEYLTITAVTGSSVSFSPSFSGGTMSTPIYAKKKVFVPATSSSTAMQSSVESLQDVGSVEVAREGPNAFEGFTWYITFSSNMGVLSCSSPSWCFSSSTESVTYVSVSGIGQGCDGNYVRTSFHRGRPKYALLGKSCHVSYDDASSEWRLRSGTAAPVLSSAASTATSVPLSGWSGGVSLALSTSPVSLLLGQGATAEITSVSAPTQPSWSNIVFSEDVGAGQHEVQEVQVSSDEDDLGGSFELSSGTISQNIIIYPHETAEDLATKLQSLSGVGRVAVEATEPTSSFGRTWLVTYLSNTGDVPLLRHHGTSNLQGTNVSLTIRELAKGDLGQHHLIVTDLEEGGLYSARVRAENDAGSGPYAPVSGGGVYPIATSASLPPDPPELTLGTITKSKAEITFTEPSANGSDISSYKFEWTTSDTFGATAEVRARVSCSDGTEVLGSFKFMYGGENPSQRIETSVPIDVRSSALEISQALGAFDLLNEVEVATTTNELSELEWAISFLYDVGPVGSLTLNTEDVRCQSEDQVVESSVTIETAGTTPAGYGSREIFTDDASCGSVKLGEYSRTQYLTLYADSAAVTAGSFQFVLGGEATECISISSTETQMKLAIEGLPNVGEVSVAASTAPTGSRFPYAYEIEFEGNYAYGEIPALRIHPSNECDPFVGGTNHRATVLPVRDESLCLNGADNTVAIVAESLTELGGSFDVIFRDKSTTIGFTDSVSDIEEILGQLIGPDVRVTQHDHGEGVAWAVTYPGSGKHEDLISIIDTRVTGRNARVNAFPLLTLLISEADSTGDFRIVIDGERTGPLSLQASEAEILREMHLLNGIGKVRMLGPSEGGSRRMIIESYTADLSTIQVVPERNWRGTAPRIFLRSPYGKPPRSFSFSSSEESILRISAKNSRGWGRPSDPLQISPASSVPDAPQLVSLSS